MSTALQKSDDLGTQEFTKKNYESDPIRILFDAHIVDYNNIIAEIQLRYQLEESTVNLLFLLVAAVLSAFQLLGEIIPQSTSFFGDAPVVYLLLAAVALLFPLRFLQNNLYIANLEKYLNRVLIPKIAAITKAMTGHDDLSKSFQLWETKNYPPNCRGLMRRTDYERRGVFAPVNGMIATYRYIFVTLPFVFCCAAFYLSKQNVPFWFGWTSIEKILVSAMIVFLIIFFVGFAFSALDYVQAAKDD